jgi:putative pyruvate formate lyase activating enzyme
MQNAECRTPNGDAGQGVRGKEVGVERLREIAFELKARGAHNINLVSPTPYTEMILEALLPVKKELGIPIVWNTNAYELVRELRRLEPLVDVYLPDLKFLGSVASKRYCGRADYFEFASAAIREMHRQKAEVKMQKAKCRSRNGDSQGEAKGKSDCRLQITDYRLQNCRAGTDDALVMTQGVIIRHLVIPGLVDDSKGVLRWIAENIGTRVHVSLMAQYTPVHKASRFPEINRRLRHSEFEAVRDYFYELGFENGWAQELSAASAEYTPEFNLRGT